MLIQHPVVQHVDTVYVAVAKLVDTVTVRVASGSVQVTDTLHAVVRQTGGEWYFIGTLVLTGALIAVTVWAHRQMHRLQQRNTDLQADHAKVQREFNEMQAQHEAERRAAEKKREEERQRAVDARVSGVAYAVRRQLRSWLDEAPAETKALVSVTDTWAEAVKQLGGKEVGEVPGLTHGMLSVTVKWAAQRADQHFNRAEERIVQLVAAAPEASAAVADSIRRAYVLFYKATGRLNRQVAVYSEHGEPSAEELATAYHELETCGETLAPAVGEELRQAEEALAP